MDIKYNTDTKIEDNARMYKLQKAQFDREINTAVSIHINEPIFPHIIEIRKCIGKNHEEYIYILPYSALYQSFSSKKDANLIPK